MITHNICFYIENQKKISDKSTADLLKCVLIRWIFYNIFSLIITLF